MAPAGMSDARAEAAGNPRHAGGGGQLMHILSGSSQFELRERISESLADGVAELSTLSFTRHERRRARHVADGSNDLSPDSF